MKVGGNKTILNLCIVGILALTFTACDTTSSNDVKSVETGEEWVVSETTSLTELNIADDAVMKAPEGYSLTMTVDGVETGIGPGAYSGDIVLTPTENIVLEYNDMGVNDTYYLRTAMYVNDSVVVPEKSVSAAVVGGEVTSGGASDISITSSGDEFNGIIVTGDSTFSLQNPKINFTGNGGNDFAGYGAALMTDGNAQVTVENAQIITRGVVRTAVFVGGHSTTKINNSTIEVHDGTFPEGYVDRYKGGDGVMMEVPWIMGITGNCRATNVVGNGTVYYNNTHIKAQAWGALSTDAVKDAKLYATNCTIETVESGYGAYADGNSLDTFSGCTFNVPDYGVIMTQGSVVFTNGTVVNSGRFGVLAHLGRGGNTLTIEKGSVFNTKKAVIQLKAGEPALNPNIVVDSAKLNSESGIILQSIATDNPKHKAKSSAATASHQSAPASGGATGTSGAGSMPGGAPPGGMQAGAPPNTDVNASFSNMALNGDIINGNTASSHMNVTLENVTVTGAITTASTEFSAKPDGGEMTMQDWEYYYVVGEVTNTYGSMPDDPHGLTVSLNPASTWVVAKTSYLTALTVAEGAMITAPAENAVTMTVDGVETPITTGTYEGNIVLQVN